MPEATAQKDREARCIAHNDAEREARLPIADSALAASWFIVQDLFGYEKLYGADALTERNRGARVPCLDTIVGKSG